MKTVITSDGSEQLAVNNVGPALGVDFCGFVDFDKLWGNPIEPGGAEPDCLIIKGFFVADYTSWNRTRKIMGDVGGWYNPKYKKAKKIVILWGGSDVLQMESFKQRCGRYEAKIFRELRDEERFCHIPVSLELGRQLAEKFNFKPLQRLATPAQKVFERMPMPEQNTIGVYLPTYRATLHRLPQIVDLALAMPDTKFILFHWFFPVADDSGNIPDISQIANIETRFTLPRDGYEKTIGDCSALLRIPRNDGLSGTAADFVMAGRPVMSSNKIPGFSRVVTNDELDEGISAADLAGKVGKFPQEVSDVVRDDYCEMFSPEKYKDRFEKIVQKQWPDFKVEPCQF